MMPGRLFFITLPDKETIPMTDIATLVASALNLPVKGVTATIELLDSGATVPFISRYRKERTGSLDEVEVRAIEQQLRRTREMEERREFVRQSIADAGGMTERLSQRLAEATTITEIEDIYAPFKPKKRTRATIAREKGLEPLAKRIMSGQMPRATDDEISGARDIIAEWASESTRLRNLTRRTMQRTAILTASPAKGKEAELAASPLAGYGTFSQSVRRIASHQYLALRRAEREGLVKVKFSLDGDETRLVEQLTDAFMPRNNTKETAATIGLAVADAYKRLLRPSVETEISASLKSEADRVAIGIFADNLRQLLLASPLKGERVLAIDPGYRTGCKTVALDEAGTLLDESVIYPTAPKNDTAGAERILRHLISTHRLTAIALGNGTASRETERFLKSAGLIPTEKIFIVSEDGASVYSASELARKEFPDKDVTVRGAVSIGRRLIDPLAELVKIDPKSIGVGQYQHDVDQAALKDALDYTVMACVNAVGVDVNTASEKLLSYISGIGPSLAANIVAYRRENGAFGERSDLKRVPRLGDKAFELSAGFLRILGGHQALDNTGIHPESYGTVAKMAHCIGASVADLPGNSALLDRLDAEKLAEAGIGGRETIADIIAELRKPGRDPRTDSATDAFHPAIESFEQLAVGQTVPGIVSNITAFGAFVNLGIKEHGLIHISRVAPRRISAVSDVLHLGQQVEAKTIELDQTRRRISLSLI